MTTPASTRTASLMPAGNLSVAPRAMVVARRLWGYLLTMRWHLLAGLVCGLIASLTQVSIFKLLERFTNGLSAQSLPAIQQVCLLLVGAYVVMGFARYGQSVLLANVAQRVGQSIRRDVYAHLQTMSLAYFHRRRTGALMSTLTSDVSKLQNTAMLIRDVITTPITMTATLIYMFNKSPLLWLIVLMATPLIAFTIQRLTRRIRGISQQTQARLADVSSVMEETLAAPRIVRAFTAEAYEVQRYEEASEHAIRSQLRAVRRSARLGPIVDLIGAVSIGFILYVGGQEVVNHHMTPGGLFAFLMAASSVANNANAYGSIKTSWEEMLGAADRLFREVLDVQPEIRDAAEAHDLPLMQGRIRFENVSFDYTPGQPVLSHLNLTVEPGEVIALVGETGAGKTTLADLIPRFYDPTAGRVTIDGCDLRDVRLHSLRRQIALVPQETLLFSGTLRDNIVYGRRDASDAEVKAAAHAANIAEFVEGLPEGYETWIGERGTTLSGGQRQRVAIARALLADPRILILDEATSALDAHTEALVQEALETLMKNRTTLIIAHRLSTVVNADKIVVLRRAGSDARTKGSIAEMGTHAELMARGGVYAALFETQRWSSQGNTEA